MTCRVVDEGAGSVLVLAVVTVLSTLGVGVLSVASGYADRQRLSVVADVAALASARTLTTQPASVCTVARRVAVDHDTVLRRCLIGTDDVLVEVEASGPWGLVLTGRSRAGPVDP